MDIKDVAVSLQDEPPGALRDRRSLLFTVDIALPHNQLAVRSYVAENTPESKKVLFMVPLTTWMENYALVRAPNPYDMYRSTETIFDYATELRVKNTRGHGSVGGWVKTPTHLRFFFKSKQTAMLFKLSWCGT